MKIDLNMKKIGKVVKKARTSVKDMTADQLIAKARTLSKKRKEIEKKHESIRTRFYVDEPGLYEQLIEKIASSRLECDKVVTVKIDTLDGKRQVIVEFRFSNDIVLPQFDEYERLLQKTNKEHIKLYDELNKIVYAINKKIEPQEEQHRSGLQYDIAIAQAEMLADKLIGEDDVE